MFKGVNSLLSIILINYSAIVGDVTTEFRILNLGWKRFLLRK